jgi:hypothetical protein
MLALRKEVLLARGSLQRLRLAQEAGALRESLRWPRAGAAIVQSLPVRSAIVGLLLGVAGHSRAIRWLTLAAVLLRFGRRLLRRFASGAAPPAPAAEPPASKPDSA